MTEEIKDVKKTEVKVKTLVVTQLPTQNYNKVTEDGVDYNLLTTEQAMTEILDILRQLKKGLL